MIEFVPASRLYDVETHSRVPYDWSESEDTEGSA